MRTTLLLLVTLLSISHDRVFSQKFSSKFYTTPVLLNPANTGRFVADYRIGGVSRTESNGLATDLTYFFSFDSRILKSSLPEQDRLAVGVAALSESDRYFGLFNKSAILSLAYFKALDADGFQKLGIGFQTNFSSKTHQSSTYVFSEQVEEASATGFSGLFFGPQRVTVNYADFNAGVIYENLINDKHLVSLGVSFLHITRPHKIFDGGEFTLSPELCLQAGLETLLSEKNKLLTNFSININSDSHSISNLTFGCIYQMAIGQSPYRISSGSFYRKDQLYGSALAPCLGLKSGNMNIIMSYDISLLQKADVQRNAFELGMTYTGMSFTKKSK